MSVWTVTVLSSVFQVKMKFAMLYLLSAPLVVLSLQSPKSLRSPVLLLYRDSERVVIGKIRLTLFLVSVLGKANVFSRDPRRILPLPWAGLARIGFWGLGQRQIVPLSLEGCQNLRKIRVCISFLGRLKRGGLKRQGYFSLMVLVVRLLQLRCGWHGSSWRF